MNRLVYSILLMSLFAVLPASGWSQDSMKLQDDVAAWAQFADELKTVGARFLQEYHQPDEISQAESPLYLAQQLSYVVRTVLARRDEAFPLLRVNATNIDKWGLDGADAKYMGAPLHSQGVYRLSGQLGSATVIAIQAVQSTPLFKAFASLSGDEFMADEEGGFSVMISRERPQGWQGPWLPMEENTTNLLVREYFNDWAKESPSRMVLERLDQTPPKPTPSIVSTTEILAEVVEEFDIRLRMWMPWLERTRSFPPNQLASLPHTGQGLKNNAYGEGWFQLEPDEALIIELADPKADLWSFQLGNQWWESIDYINHTGSLNGHQAVANNDGKYRLVISLQDPGVPNWLDPAGHVKGLIMYRFQNTAAMVAVPEMRLVKFDELERELPRDTIAITKAQRQAEIEMRRAHALKRWAP